MQTAPRTPRGLVCRCVSQAASFCIVATPPPPGLSCGTPEPLRESVGPFGGEQKQTDPRLSFTKGKTTQRNDSNLDLKKGTRSRPAAATDRPSFQRQARLLTAGSPGSGSPAGEAQAVAPWGAPESPALEEGNAFPECVDTPSRDEQLALPLARLFSLLCIFYCLLFLLASCKAKNQMLGDPKGLDRAFISTFLALARN